jgi:hypothetical protein
MKPNTIKTSLCLLPVLLLVPTASTHTPLPGSPGVALAAEAAIPFLTGVKLPKGAQHLMQNDLPTKLALLLNSAGNEIKMPAVQDEAEVLMWRTTRGAFVRIALQAALREAGYKVEDVDDQKVYKTNIFDEQFGLVGEPVNASSIDQSGYFTAKNEQKRQTLMAGWILGEERIVIALAQTGFRANPKAAPLPEVSGENVILVKDNKDAMKGVAPPKMPTFPKMAAKPNTVRGMVKDAGGKPVAGARIIAQTSIAGGLRTDSHAITNAGGIYEIKLPIGVSQVVNADCNFPYNGKSYRLPLHAVDGKREYFNARNGHVEHFTLRTFGAGEGSNFYGGVVRAIWFGPDIGDTGTLEVMLKPQGPLLGGSAGRTLVFRFLNKGGAGEEFLNNIPIGRYAMSARLIDNGETLPLRLREHSSDEAPTSTLQIEFEPQSGPLAVLGSSGVQRINVMLQP